MCPHQRKIWSSSHELRHVLGFEITKVPGEELIVGVVLECSDGLGVVVINDLLLLFLESSPVAKY